MITLPGSLELRLLDGSTEFCNEPLHRDHLIYRSRQAAPRRTCEGPGGHLSNCSRLSKLELLYFVRIEKQWRHRVNRLLEGVKFADCPWKGIMTSQSFTYIDPAGNQAQYTVYDVDRHNEYHWSTDHGDSGSDASYVQAQNRARTALKASMAARRRPGQGYH